MSQEKIKRWVGLNARLQTDRSSYMTSWQELSEYIDPWRGRFNDSDRNRGGRRDRAIIDNIGRRALRTMASGMMAGLTSPARPWFRLGTHDTELMEEPDVRDWLHLVEGRMREVMSRSNMYNALHTLYGDLGLYGTASMTCMDDDDDVIRFYPQVMGSFVISNNHRLMVDTIIRESSMTVRQLLTKYGKEKVSTNVRHMADMGNMEEWVQVIHVVEPANGKIDGKIEKFPYRSAWFEKHGNEGKLLSESGFSEFPAMTPRWEVNGEDVWGYSPGMMAIGDVRALQLQQRRKAQAIDKHVDPPMVANPSLRNKRSSLLPGDVTYVDVAAGGVGYQPAYEIKPEIQSLLMDSQEMRERIQSAFFADLFMMLANDRRSNVTAREVEERHEEKLLMLGPVLERLNTELLDPLIDRVFGIMVRRGMIPPAPEALQGDNLKVEYISILAQAQKSVGLGAIDRLVGYVGGIAQFDPSVLDKIDLDQSVDEYSSMLGTPPTIVRDDKKVADIRGQRAKAQAQQQAMEAAPAARDMAQATKALSESEMGGDSALNEVVNAMGGM